MKKTNTAIMSLVMCVAMLLSACEGVVTSISASATTQTAQTEKVAEETRESARETPAPARDVVVIQVGFENVIEEPIGEAVEKWAELLAAENSRIMELELFLSSSLGSESGLISQMIMGEGIITIADDAFYANYDVPDLGTFYGSFSFDNWNKVWELVDGDWYQIECGKPVDEDLTVLASNWVYNEHKLMIRAKMVMPANIRGKKVRLANNQIYVEDFNALGVAAVPMALDNVYTSLQDGTLDGVENPLSTLYGQSFQGVSKNTLTTEYILNFITWYIGIGYLSTLTPGQQELLRKIGGEVGLYNNEQQAAANDDYRKELEKASVVFMRPTGEKRALWEKVSLSLCGGGSQFGWSNSLCDTVKVTMQ